MCVHRTDPGADINTGEAGSWGSFPISDTVYLPTMLC